MGAAVGDLQSPTTELLATPRSPTDDEDYDLVHPNYLDVPMMASFFAAMELGDKLSEK
jgi:hypothetical protein